MDCQQKRRWQSRNDSGLHRLEWLARFQPGIGRKRGERFSILDLEFFPLIGSKESASGLDFDQVLLWLECDIECCRSLRDIRHLALILADIGLRPVTIM